MATIVAGFGVPHTPEFPALVERDGPKCETAQLYREIAQQIETVRPDALVIFTSDHLNTFFLNNYPCMCIGAADQTEGPNDETRMPHYRVAVAEQLASHLYRYGLESGFDLALAQEFGVDHTVMVPLHFLTPSMSIPIVPVFINGLLHPMPAAKRCYALGQMVAGAVAELPGGTSVAVLGSGSFSLDIGGSLAPRGRYAGTPDEAWVDTILGHLRQGDADGLLNAATADRMARAGNVAGELLNWIAMLGATGPRQPALLEPQMDRGHAAPGAGIEDFMSTYFVHKVAQLVRKNPEFRERMQRDPAGAIADFRLSDEERRAILSGDVGRLLELGAHGYLLGSLGRHGIAGLSMESYSERAHEPSTVSPSPAGKGPGVRSW